MTTTHIIVAENKHNFSAETIKHAVEGRYNTKNNVDVSNKIVSISFDDKSYKEFKKITGKNYEKAVETVVYEDFTDEFDQEFNND